MLHETEAAYRRALEWIHSIGRFGIKQGLQRIEALLSLDVYKRQGQDYRIVGSAFFCQPPYLGVG